MDFQHQYYLSTEFNNKICKILLNIANQENNKKEFDEIFNKIYPAIIKFVNYKKINNPDIISDYILQVYQDFPEFLLKAKNFYKNSENFIFYYYFIKFLYFEWQNFFRKRKTIDKKDKKEELEYLDKIDNESFIVSSNKDKWDLEQIKRIIKKCLENHFEVKEKVMFLLYYYFLLENEEFIIIAKFLNIPVLSLIDEIDNQKNYQDNLKFSETLNEKLITRFFGSDINSFRVNISRIKKKMKIKCNYLKENYLFIDEGDL